MRDVRHLYGRGLEAVLSTRYDVECVPVPEEGGSPSFAIASVSGMALISTSSSSTLIRGKPCGLFLANLRSLRMGSTSRSSRDRQVHKVRRIGCGSPMSMISFAGRTGFFCLVEGCIGIDTQAYFD